LQSLNFVIDLASEEKKDFRKLTNDEVKLWFKKKFEQRADFDEISAKFIAFIGAGLGSDLIDVNIEYWVKEFGPVLGSSLHKKIQEDGKQGGGEESKIDQLLTSNKRIERGLTRVSKEVIIQKRQRLDIWTPSKRSLAEQAGFKDALTAYYERGDGKDNNELKCMILNQFFPRKHVRASHIWKYCTLGKYLPEFGLIEEDVGSPRNGLLLAESIEEKFDSKDVCFIYNAMRKHIQLFVLNPVLLNMEKPVYVSPSDSVTFAQIDGAQLLCGDGKPFRRILAWHAKLAIDTALSRRWINKADKEGYETLLALSEGAHFPDTEIERHTRFSDSGSSNSDPRPV